MSELISADKNRMRAMKQAHEIKNPGIEMESEKVCGFSLIELMIGVVVAGIIAAMTVPMALTSLKDYHLNADAANLANYANVARMKAASQYAPYRLNINTTNGTFTMEKLCGDTPSSVDGNCSGGLNPYSPFSTPQIDLGTQYAAQGDTYSSCRPNGISVFPGDITADPANCPALLQIYFNTRGVPVNSNGGPLTNGGAVVYITNPDNLVDAVTFSLGGRVAVWTWNSGTSQWVMR